MSFSIKFYKLKTLNPALPQDGNYKSIYFLNGDACLWYSAENFMGMSQDNLKSFLEDHIEIDFKEFITGKNFSQSYDHALMEMIDIASPTLMNDILDEILSLGKDKYEQILRMYLYSNGFIPHILDSYSNTKHHANIKKVWEKVNAHRTGKTTHYNA